MVLFWGHRAAKDGSVTKSCFSQWFEAAFTLDGIRYASAEQYMMAEKARLFNDDAVLGRILEASAPDAVKALGREIGNFNEEVWRSHRWEIVVRANQAKFSQNPALQAFLVQTGDQVLVEASPVDRIWGIGLAADDARARQPAAWNGLNLLGFALMEVRSRLAPRDAEETSAHLLPQ
nr:NADAR family protein [Pseudoduganella lutea]